jgi:hypothetical protein
MPRIMCGTLLLFASLAWAQQQQTPQQRPPYTTPPTFPESRDPGQHMPPDTQAPQEEQGEANPDQPTRTSAQIGEQIQRALDTEPLLKGSTLKVEVDDTKVTITGTVNNQKEREMALSAAALYAGEREIVDQIKIKT